MENKILTVVVPMYNVEIYHKLPEFICDTRNYGASGSADY